MQQKKNPLFIFLGVCGGCVLLAIIAFVVMAAIGLNKGKGLINGTMGMVTNMPKFLGDLKTKNYIGASALIDPTVSSTLNADKIQKIEEGVEKKLGPLQSYPAQFSSQDQSTSTDPTAPGKMPSMEYTYKYKLTYAKGTATAVFKFNNPDVLHPSGLITDFAIEPDAAKKSPQQ